MKTIATIEGKALTLILKTIDKAHSAKTIGWVELRVPYLVSMEAPVINLNNEKVPYGIPASKDTKFKDNEGDWLKVRERVADGKVVESHKWLITANARYNINRLISKTVLANREAFGLPKVDLTKEATTNFPVSSGTAGKVDEQTA